MTAERDFRMTDDHKAEALDLDALEVVANAATAGPWWTGVGLGSFQYTVEGLDADFHLVAQRLIHPDATHVANFDPPTVLALIAALKEARERVADVWDEGHKAPWRRGPDSCRCSAWSSGECACGMYGNGELLSLNDNPYRRSETP